MTMCYRYVYKYGSKENPVPRYHKKSIDVDGKRYMLTRYTFEIAFANHWADGSKVEGPRGGKAVREFARYVWYSQGRFFRISRKRIAENTFANEMEPIHGAVWDCHVDQSNAQRVPVACIECDDGRPTQVTLDGISYRMDESMWPMCEEILYLDGRRCPKGRVVAIHAEAVA